MRPSLKKTKQRKNEGENGFYNFFFLSLKVKHILLRFSYISRSLEKSLGQRHWARRAGHTNCSRFSLGSIGPEVGETEPKGKIGRRSLVGLRGTQVAGEPGDWQLG